MAYKILAINPGSTSTKVAVYVDKEQQWVESISHSAEELKPFNDIYDQLDFRTDLVIKCYEKHAVPVCWSNRKYDWQQKYRRYGRPGSKAA